MTSGNAPTPAQLPAPSPAQGARQHHQAPLTSLGRPGPHLTQPPDIRGHGQQAVDSYDRRFPRGSIRLCMQSDSLLERCFSKLKQFRAVATRYDKREQIYQGTVDVASIRIWLRDPVP